MRSAAAAHPHLLVAENEPAVLHLVQDTFEAEGWAVTPARSLPALLALQSLHPLLAQAAPIPVGIMTGREVEASAALQAGTSFLVRKPFELDDLIRAVQQELSPRPCQAQQQLLVKQFFAALLEEDW